jgi:RNA recognition motif-containing protein
VSKKVFVGNLNFDTNEEGLRQHFSSVGNVVDLHIPLNRDTGRPRGFAFVTFSTEEEASAAIERLNGESLDGRPLRIDVAEESPRKKRRDFGGGGGGGRDFGGGGRGGDGAGRGGDHGRRGPGGPRNFPEFPPEEDPYNAPRKKGGGSRRGLRGRKRGGGDY